MTASGSCRKPLAMLGVLAVLAAIPASGRESKDAGLVNPVEAVFDGLGELIFKMEKRFEKERPLQFDVTKPITSQADALDVLNQLDEFLAASTFTPRTIYLPVHLSLTESDNVLLHSHPDYPWDCDARDSTGAPCTPAFFSRPMIASMYSQGELDSDVRRALANFIRALNAAETTGRASVRFHQVLPLLEKDYGSNPIGPNRVVDQDARDKARNAWFNDPCSQVAESGRDEGWSKPRDAKQTANDLLIEFMEPCSVSNDGTGTRELTAEEMQAFVGSPKQDLVAIKNQPPSSSRGEPSGYRGKDLARHAYEGEYAVRYLRYEELQPPWHTKKLPSEAVEERAVQALDEVKDEDTLSAFERRFMRRILIDAVRSLSSTGAAAVKIPRGVRVVLGNGDFYDVAVPAKDARSIEFPVGPVRASFLHCEPYIAKLMGLTRSEEECRAVGGQPRELQGGWPATTNTEYPDWMGDFDARSNRTEQTTIERARERVRPLICGRVNTPQEQIAAVNDFNACVVDQLWFLLHHELAHIYLGTRGKPDMSSEDRQDCHGLLHATAVRPHTSLGVFENEIAVKAIVQLRRDPQRYGSESGRILARLEALRANLLPLARRNELTPETCRTYSSSQFLAP